MNRKFETIVYESSSQEAVTLIKIYIAIRIVFMILLIILGICACVGLHNINESIQHFIYHAFDCCEYR